MADAPVPQETIPQDSQVNVFNPENELVSIPVTQLGQATDMGYRAASPEETHEYQLQAEHGGAGSQVGAFAEGVGRGVSFGASTGLERALGVNPENIRKRQEANPLASMAGEVTGIAGSSLLPGVGEANILSKAGAAGAEALGLGGAGILSKVGSLATKGAIETAMVQGGNEVHKMFASDPNQTAATAIADIGLAGLMGAGIGGAFGTVSPLWQATVGKRLGNTLELFQQRANGEAIKLPSQVESALSASGIELNPEIRAGLAQNSNLNNMFNTLREASTQPAHDLQESLFNFRKGAADEVLNAFGKTTDTIPDSISHFEAGHALQDDLAKIIEDKVKPISEGFNEIRDKFKKIPLTQADDVAADRLAQIADAEGWTKSPSSGAFKLYNDTLKELPLQKSLDDLRTFQTTIQNKAKGNLELYYPAKKIIGVLRDVEGSALERAAGEKGADSLMKLQLARTSYKEMAETIESLNDRLRVGKYGGPDTFIHALRDMKPEDIINRLSKGNDAGLLDLLNKEFPEITNKIRDYQVNKILSSAAAKAPEGMPINSKKVFEAINKMTPEMKQFVMTPEVSAKLEGINALLDAVPEYKSSWTAKHQENLWGHAPAGAGALASILLGHGPIGAGVGALLGAIGKWGIRDAPDAVRLGLLKFLGTAGPVEPGAFKAMIQYASAVYKGESLMNKGVGALFKASSEVLPRTKLPTETNREKLDKRIQALAQDPSPLVNTGGQSAYYLPDHGSAMSATAMRAVNYLNSVRPKEVRPGILDKPLEPSIVAKAKYDRALDIADKPLSILESVKNGSVTPEDVITLRTVHPDLYARLSDKIFNELAAQTEKDHHVPYDTRIGLSMFLGQALDGTMTPQSIQMNQMQMHQASSGAQQQQAKGPGPHSYKSLSKLPMSAMTPDQQRSAKRAGMS